MNARRKSRKFLHEFIEYIVQLWPRSQPAPAFLYRFSRHKGLKKSLSARLVVHKSAISLSKSRRRKHQVCLSGGAIREGVQGDDMEEFRQELIDDRRWSPAIKIVLDNDESL